MKKRFAHCLVTAVAAASCFASFGAQAQSATPVTRAQVRAELVQLEAAGYRVGGGEDVGYPARLQAAEQRVAVAGQGERAAGYGGNAAATTESGNGHRAFEDGRDGMKSVYFGG